MVNASQFSSSDRLAVLSDLGYELADFDLWEGWMILEESSAERVVRDVLVPLFTPRLSQVRTVAAQAISRVTPVFADFCEMFCFTNLVDRYRAKAWVRVDGDGEGKRVVEKLRGAYRAWPTPTFDCWTEARFEDYYPDRFRGKVDEAFVLEGQGRRDAKKALVLEVVDWAQSDWDTARAEFGVSASEVIKFLNMVENALFGEQRK
jgi:hypothetical protein